MIDYRMDAAAVVARMATAVHGIVSAVDPVNSAVKVMVMPEGVESGWIPDAAGVAAGDLRIGRPSCVGSHVLLLPIDGDAEHLAIVGIIFDAVVTPPQSPRTGKVAQPGELLIRTGCGAPPPAEGGQVGAAQDASPWWHITPAALYCGAGNVSAVIQSGGIEWRVGGVLMTLGSEGLQISGGNILCSQDIKTNQHSLNGHVHGNGNDGTNTGGPIG